MPTWKPINISNKAKLTLNLPAFYSHIYGVSLVKAAEEGAT